MPGLPLHRKVTKASLAADSAELLARGPLVLNLTTRILNGPSGWAALSKSEFDVLRLLMEPRLVSGAELAAAAFPASEQQPRRPDHALAMRLARLRTTLEVVGVRADALQNYCRQGWTLGVGGDDVRTFTGVRLKVLTRLLETHPDREGVALLG